MEVLAILISVASLLTNIIIVRRYIGSLKVEKESFLFEPLPEIETAPQVEEPEAVVLPERVSEPKVPTSNSPWQNKTNIPWNESLTPTSQPVTPQVSVPLERPYGFS